MALSIGIYTNAGKKIYSTTTYARNGRLITPAFHIPAGMYRMSIDGTAVHLAGSFAVIN
jgi:hypothetical protein